LAVILPGFWAPLSTALALISTSTVSGHFWFPKCSY
jgi:hypothetical protein